MKDRQYLMGIDIGTSESKGCIIDAQGAVSAFSAVNGEPEAQLL